MPRVNIFQAWREDIYSLNPLLEAATLKSVRRQLEVPGVALLAPAQLNLSRADLRDLRRLSASFDKLVPDPYDPSRRRYRAHGELSIETNGGYPVITLLGTSSYRQAAQLNPSEGGRERLFDPLPKLLMQKLFWRLLIGLLDCLPATIRQSATLRAQVHQLSYRAGPGPAVPPPLGLHRDGEPFTAIVLIAKRDLRGGDTIIANDAGELLLGHALSDPLEIIIINDSAVLHAVSPVLQGRRDVLLIDYTPKLPHVMLEARSERT